MPGVPGAFSKTGKYRERWNFIGSFRSREKLVSVFLQIFLDPLQVQIAVSAARGKLLLGDLKQVSHTVYVEVVQMLACGSIQVHIGSKCLQE